MPVTLFDVALEGRVRELEAVLAELVAEVHFGVRRSGFGPLLTTGSSIYQRAAAALGTGHPIPEPYIDERGRRFFIPTPLGQRPPSEAMAHQIRIRSLKGGRR